MASSDSIGSSKRSRQNFRKLLWTSSAQKLLYSSDSAPWISFGLAILQTKNKMGLDKQMFLISENDAKDKTIIKFYGSIFEVL